MIIRGETTKENLQHIYSTIRRIIKNPECYYTEEQLQELLLDDNNNFIKLGKKEVENG